MKDVDNAKTNLEHRTRILAELAAQGFIQIKQKKPKYLERYLCFYSSNKTPSPKKSASVTPVSSECDMTDAMLSVTL